MQDLGTLGGTSSAGNAINAAGQITGYANTVGDAAQHAFLYTNGAMVDLNTLIAPSSPLEPYVTLSEGRDISDTGFIVADGIDARTGETHAYLLTPPLQGVSDCAHTTGIAPLFDAVFDRQAGPPDTYQASFEAPNPESGFVCIDNGVNGNPSITSGTISLNGVVVVGPEDWTHAHDARRAGNQGNQAGQGDQSGQGDQGGAGDSSGAPASSIQASVSLLSQNSLTAQLASKPGSEIRVRVFAAAPAP
jgi:probable HAF family extracellular repeat protein